MIRKWCCISPVVLCFSIRTGYVRTGHCASHVPVLEGRNTVLQSTTRPVSRLLCKTLVTFYSHILSLGVKPRGVILSGDSAGGNLVIALLRYLESSSNLPLPGGAITWSPWVHVTPQAGADYERSKNSTDDCLTPPLLQWGAQAYFPIKGPTLEELVYISPLYHPFQTKVPLIIHGGTTEAFFDMIEDFVKEMAMVDGNRVKFYKTNFASHDLTISCNILGLENEVEGVLS
ncbi:Alpha/Beta hydrolase protein [Xylaria nigripes]|nr:Alpha/Beta hydrolase protein [Xylaria nigripes]